MDSNMNTATAAKYRQRADEVRASAQTATDLKVREILLDAAKDFEHMATLLDAAG
jgi:hypothetical protein